MWIGLEHYELLVTKKPDNRIVGNVIAELNELIIKGYKQEFIIFIWRRVSNLNTLTKNPV